MFKLKCSKFNDNFVQLREEISNLGNLLVAANSLNGGVKTLDECNNQLERRPLSTVILSAFSK